jgi:hypothetical protein
MSKYSHLPIYIDAGNLLKEFYLRIPKFDKQYKYLLGGKLVEYSTNTVAIIMEINNSRDTAERQRLIMDLEKNIEMMLVYIRISFDLKQINSGDSYMFLSEKIINILKQAEGWKKYLNKDAPRVCIT